MWPNWVFHINALRFGMHEPRVPVDQELERALAAGLVTSRPRRSDCFPGYYTLDVARDGKVIGMLSVNAYSGQVWYHAWHGTFVQEKDLD